MRALIITGPGAVRYAGSQADARVKREEIVSITGCKKKDVIIDKCEVPTGKAELLPFINELCKKADAP